MSDPIMAGIDLANKSQSGSKCSEEDEYLRYGELGFWVCDAVNGNLDDRDITVRELQDLSSPFTETTQISQLTECLPAPYDGDEYFNWNMGLNWSSQTTDPDDCGYFADVLNEFQTYVVYTDGGLETVCGSAGGCKRILARWGTGTGAPDVWGLVVNGEFVYTASNGASSTGPGYVIDSSIPKWSDFEDLWAASISDHGGTLWAITEVVPADSTQIDCSLSLFGSASDNPCPTNEGDIDLFGVWSGSTFVVYDSTY